MSWFTFLKRFRLTQTCYVKNIIIVGVGSRPYQLANAIIEAGLANIIAFIDDEPWNNRTELLGATVRYPSDIAALVQRYKVDIIIDLEGELSIAQNIWQEVEGTSVTRLRCPKTTSLDELLHCLRSQ
ncbi:hypothetical protein DN730_01410 [Marinomonas piezotolerans]|uniref:CoA-binding domain-containing protein n=1 Tax=Marinomonas piezotolerans TaxID=2213058 RepID=A0A370UD69_9GAMM|nr:hypothetical protein [Marinomonas piezotolerans]RDL45733.1 hypothetical protein DN730_01410 [Marinomonas piezotolerans]